jgi:hypothetical protein
MYRSQWQYSKKCLGQLRVQPTAWCLTGLRPWVSGAIFGDWLRAKFVGS